MKNWILKDIEPKLDSSQYGNRLGTGTEHLLISLVDRILKLLDENNKSAVIASLLDWSSAFDRQDPTLAVKKFLEIGIRTPLIPVLVSYLSDREMQVKYKGSLSETHHLPGGGPQGTMIGLIEYMIQSNDNADCVNPSDRFKFVDDLTLLELVSISQCLSEYKFTDHVASDIGIGHDFLDPDTLRTQMNLDWIADWTKNNLMKLNEKKTNYMIFSRAEYELTTRLNVNSELIERTKAAKIVGVWLTEDLKWAKNTKEMCKKAYARMTMITKLKYVGTSREDLLEIFVLYIRSLLEYCCTVWHSSLTIEQQNNIENVQKLGLKIILGKDYTTYEDALKLASLQTLRERREIRCLKFGLKSLLHSNHSKLFPLNPQLNVYNTRNPEHFLVNKATTEQYRNSTIPFVQRMLNSYVQNKMNYNFVD